MKAHFHGSVQTLGCLFTFSAHVTFVWLSFSCLRPPHRGDSGVSERAAGDLSQFAIQARALSVHPQASQWLCGSFPATAPGRGQRHRPGSHLLHRYVLKHKHTLQTPPLYPFTPAGYTFTCPYMLSSVLVFWCCLVFPQLWLCIRI